MVAAEFLYLAFCVIVITNEPLEQAMWNTVWS